MKTAGTAATPTASTDDIVYPPLTATEPVNQQIYRALRTAIVQCKLLPGAPLSEKDMAERFGVSRQPVREAFIKLAESGLVRILPQRGTFVTRISVRQVQEARFIRDALETAIVKRAAASIGKDALQLLGRNLKAQAAAVKADDLPGFLALDDAFHAILADSIDCPRAWATIEDLKAHMDRVRYLTLGSLSPLDHLLTQHREVYDALSRHDAGAAEAAMQHHLGELTQTVGGVAEQHPAWFE